MHIICNFLCLLVIFFLYNPNLLNWIGQEEEPASHSTESTTLYDCRAEQIVLDFTVIVACIDAQNLRW